MVDDFVSIDQEVFNMEAFEGADWVRVSDEVPVDTDALDTAMERFQTMRHAPAGDSVKATELEPDDDDLVEEEEELEPTRPGGVAMGYVIAERQQAVDWMAEYPASARCAGTRRRSRRSRSRSAGG